MNAGKLRILVGSIYEPPEVEHELETLLLERVLPDQVLPLTTISSHPSPGAKIEFSVVAALAICRKFFFSTGFTDFSAFTFFDISHTSFHFFTCFFALLFIILNYPGD